MTLYLIIFWTVIISLLTVGSAYYARRFNRSDALIALFVTLVIFANIAASKTISFDLGFKMVFAPAVVVIFSVTFLLTDIVNEKFGRAETQRMILIALGCQVAVILFSYLILKASPAPFFTNQAAFESLLGSVPRIILASLTAFFVSENLDAYLFAWFKKLTGGKHLWMRNAFSTIPAMIVDSTLFITIAFLGSLPILPLIIGQSLIKWLVAVIDIPFMYLGRKMIR